MSCWKVKIEAKEAQSLRLALNTRKFLYTLKDYAFLCKDLAPFENDYSLRKELEEIKAFSQKLGNFVPPTFEIKGDVSCINYLKTGEPNKEEELKILCGSTLNWKFNMDGISFFVLRASDNKILFWNGPFPNRESEQYPFTRNKVILEMANYFGNRQALYKKIHESLLKNREELCQKTNEEFAKDLILLFSVKNLFRNIPAFLVDKAKVKEITLKEFLLYVEEETLGYITCYLEEGEGLAKTFSQLRLSVKLNKRNELLFVVDILYPTIPEVGDIYPEIKDVIVARTSNFLQQIVASLYFGNAIYEKVKTRLFLTNI